MVYIGVVGSRRRNSYSDIKKIYDELDKRVEEYGIGNITLVSGGCNRGGDRFAEWYQNDAGLPNPMVIHYPDKTNPVYLGMVKQNHRAAYAIIAYERNTLIARDSDELIALVASDRKGGTEDTIRKYLKFGKTKLTLL